MPSPERSRRFRVVAAAAPIGVLLLLPPKVPLVGRPADVLTVVRAMNARLDPSVPLVLVNPIDITAVLLNNNCQCCK